MQCLFPKDQWLAIVNLNVTFPDYKAHLKYLIFLIHFIYEKRFENRPFIGSAPYNPVHPIVRKIKCKK